MRGGRSLYLSRLRGRSRRIEDAMRVGALTTRETSNEETPSPQPSAAREGAQFPALTVQTIVRRQIAASVLVSKTCSLDGRMAKRTLSRTFTGTVGSTLATIM